jgi:hypothetical protein
LTTRIFTLIICTATAATGEDVEKYKKEHPMSPFTPPSSLFTLHSPPFTLSPLFTLHSPPFTLSLLFTNFSPFPYYSLTIEP